MKRDKSRQAVLVGIFIFFGLAALLAGLLIVGKQRSAFEKTLLLHARFKDVNGLIKGNNVWYAGVKIGTVKNVDITPGGLASVALRINDESTEFVSRDSKIKIGSDGLIGNRILVIYGGTPGLTIHNGDTLASDSPASNAEMMSTLQESNRNVSEVTGDLKIVSKRLANGEGTLGQLLTTDSLSRQLQQTSRVLQAAALNMNSFSARMAGYSAQLNHKGSVAHELVADTALYSSLRNAASDIRQAATAARASSEQINMATSRLNDSSNVAGVLLNDKAAAGDVRTAVANLQAGTQKFDESMEALQHNFLLRRYFKKKAKKEKQLQATTNTAAPLAKKEQGAAPPLAHENH